MMSITPFDLPTDPSKQIHLREATVAECMEVAGTDPAKEEQVTTLFLNKIQAPEHFVDARSLTAQTRRTLLVWYRAHTESDPTMVLPYNCGHCGETHHWICELHQILAQYKPFQGKPEREFEWRDCGVVRVTPLVGEDMELLELMRLDWELTWDKYGKDSGVAQQKLVALRVERLIRSVEFQIDAALEPKEREAKREERIMAMRASVFGLFAGKVSEKLAELDHGIPSVYEDGKIFLLTQHLCENAKEVTRLRIPFRCHDYIPRL